MHRRLESTALCLALLAPVPGQGRGEPLALVGANAATRHLLLREKDARRVEALWRRDKLQELLAFADGMIAGRPLDFRGHALAYLAHEQLGRDPILAVQAAAAATVALAPEPGALGEFVTRAMFFAPTANDYRIAAKALTAVLPKARTVAAVRAPHFRALVGAGDIDAAVAAGRDLVDVLRGEPTALTDVLASICDAKDVAPLAPLARRIVERFRGARGDRVDPDVLLLEYRLQRRLGQDEEATSTGRRLMVSVPRSKLSTFVWRLLTAAEHAREFQELALLGAEEMLRSKELPGHDYDTVALAMFRNGKLAAAVHYQTLALQHGYSGNPRYRKRLDTYREALSRQRAQELRGKAPR